MTADNKLAQTTLYFSLIKERWLSGENKPKQSISNETLLSSAISHSALFVQSGSLVIKKQTFNANAGMCIQTGDQLANESKTDTTILRFIVSRTAIDTAEHAQCLLSQAFSTNLQQAILRLDQVDFPPAAIAYKHTHPGAGIRYLLNGGLQLESDHGVQHYKSDEAWFEDRNSPVKATAIDSEPSRFVRAMLLPIEFEGKGTLNLLNASDEQKPRLQTNIRHDEQRVVVN